jgi:hypothetical protein
MSEIIQRSNIFISYHQKNKRWLERITIQLSPLVRKEQFEIWDDTRISTGAKWREEIEKALSAARVAVLVISAEYLASEFIVNGELTILLKAAQQQAAIILNLVVSPCRIDLTPLSEFQPVNPFDQPLTGLTRYKQDLMLVKLTRDIEAALKA